MATRWQRFVVSISPVNTTIHAAAPTQQVRTIQVARAVDGSDMSKSAAIADPEKMAIEMADVEIVPPAETLPTKPNTFDKVTKLAGSSAVFFVMIGIILIWAAYGVVSGPTDTWQIVMQNASSVQVYLTDILLLRQQQNASRALMKTMAELQSRNLTCQRLLSQLPECRWLETHKDAPREILFKGQTLDQEVEASLTMVEGTISRPRAAWNRICHVISSTLGNVYAFTFYWIGVTVWVFLGIPLQFSNVWQLYINTATAVALTFTSVFLQNIQQTQEDKLEKALHYALKVDAEIEYRLRELTEDEKPNPYFSIEPRPLRWSERAIHRFACIMGSGLGVAITLAFGVVWVSVGPLLEFSDNWWLIVGTFTGLVGFVDGFVLRNLYSREENDVNLQFRHIQISDAKVLETLNVQSPSNPMRKIGFSERVSIVAGDLCAHRYTSVSAVGLCFILLTIATALLWSETGQLLCNTPTMIIEGFLLLVLIQAHNTANLERGVEFNGVLKRRLLLSAYVHALED